jgi:hypothetical protein
MLNYFDFLLEKTKLESQYFYSVRLRQFLTDIFKSKKPGFEIAEFLLHAESSNQVSDDITFIDMTDFNDKISFIQLNRVKRMYDLTKKEFEDDGLAMTISFEQWLERLALSEEADVWHKQRTDLYVGRFTNRVSEKSGKKLDGTEIEKFVNTYKSMFDLVKSGLSRFEEVNGEIIKHWYHMINYEEVKGQLGNSCMRKGGCQSYFKIYTENPEVCSLLILKSEVEGKIAGRALVWKLENGTTYMDRVYTVRDSDYQLFEDYAKKNNYQTEECMSYSDFRKMKVKLKKWRFDEYPYMDTFKCLNVEKGYLSADEDLWPSKGFWKLEDTCGGYDGDNLVWSNYHDEYIDRDDAVETLRGDWVYQDQAVYLEYKDGYATQDEETVRCNYNDQNYYTDDTYYSEIMEDSIYSDEAYEIVVNADGETDWIHEDMRNNLVKVEVDGEERETLPILCIWHPIKEQYYFKDDMVDGNRVVYNIIKSAELIEWDEVVKQILESDFSIGNIKVKFDDLTCLKNHRDGLDKLRSIKVPELNNLIKCMLIISPDKNDRRPNTGRPLLPKEGGHERFNRLIISKYRNTPSVEGLITDEIISRTSSWFWNERFFMSAILLSDELVSDVLKDPRAIATWYSVKMPH